mmetsp:Transcript_6818/g.12020  ORF Transcript_6818/g.12020 Transcript_6818/m.12020 type:complete len:261 (-) Transcript_6818:183-965(-)
MFSDVIHPSSSSSPQSTRTPLTPNRRDPVSGACEGFSGPRLSCSAAAAAAAFSNSFCFLASFLAFLRAIFFALASIASNSPPISSLTLKNRSVSVLSEIPKDGHSSATGLLLEAGCSASFEESSSGCAWDETPAKSSSSHIELDTEGATCGITAAGSGADCTGASLFFSLSAAAHETPVFCFPSSAMATPSGTGASPIPRRVGTGCVRCCCSLSSFSLSPSFSLPPSSSDSSSTFSSPGLLPRRGSVSSEDTPCVSLCSM